MSNPLVDDDAKFDPTDYASGPLAFAATGDPSTLNPVSRGPDNDWFSGTGLLDDGVNIGKDIASGDWTKAVPDAASAVIDDISLATNPIATLVSWGCGWMLDHIKPLELMMDELCGNPNTVGGIAKTWKNISEALGRAAKQYQQQVSADTAGWQGRAADAYRKHAANALATALGTGSALALAMSDLVTIGEAIVSTVHDTVRDLISGLIGQLVQEAIEEAASLGLATPAVVGQVCAYVAKYLKDAKYVVKALEDALTKGADLAARIVTLVSQLLKLLRNLEQNHGLSGPVPPAPQPA